MSFGKNASPALCFPKGAKDCVAANGVQRFSACGSAARLFYFPEDQGVMDDQISLYGALSGAYDVARDITEQLEHEYLQGSLDAYKQEVLSGCYSAVDFFSNLIAKLGLEEEDESSEEPRLEPGDYSAAAELMKAYVEILEGDLACDETPTYVDYRKVHSLVGLRKVYHYIESIE